jgi:hypothetical protein
MKHIWSILCKESVIDRNTNNISILNVLEEMILLPPSREVMEKSKKPIKIPLKLELVSLWEDKKRSREKKLDVRIEKYGPGKEMISVFERKIPIPKDKKRLRTIVKIMGFGFTKPGTYLFRVRVKTKKRYKLVAELPLEVHIKFPSK